MYYLHKKSLLRAISLALTVLLSFPLFTSLFIEAENEDTPPESEVTIHVKAGGNGDGSGADTPLSDISDAFAALSESGGRIVVYGKYELAASSLHDKTWEAFVEPEHKGSITISGSDAFLVCKENYRYYMSGSTKFENIGISGSGALVIAARYNPLCMGEGINIIGFSDGVFLVGGYNGSNSGLSEETLSSNTYIEIQSGNYKYVCGYNKGTGSKSCTGEAQIVVSGGKINCISAGLSNFNTAFNGNSMQKLNVKLSGGEIFKICDADMPSYGDLSEFELEWSGGIIENIIVSESVSSSVSFTEEMSAKAAEFLRYFDRYKKGDGEFTETDKIKVACIGDSITAGVRAEGEADISYPAKLSQMLGNSYDVRNFGEGGSTVISASGSAYINTQKYKDSLDFLPDVVFIMLGTNDLAALISDATAKDTLYRDMITMLQSYSSLESKPVIYLLSPTQRTDDSELSNAMRDILVPCYKQIAEDTKVGYIDIYEISKSVKDQFSDALHPNETAASHIATWLYSAVVTNSNIGGIHQNTTHVEIVISSPESPSVPSEPGDTDNNKSQASPVIAVIIIIALIISAAAVTTYLGKLKSKESDVPTPSAEADEEKEKEEEEESV